MMKFTVRLTLILSFFTICSAGYWAAGLGYEIYTVQAGDTRENLASRWGITPESIISVDNIPWQAGKQVAVCGTINLPTTPAPQPTPQIINTAGGARQAKVVLPDYDIRSDKGEFLFRPEVGSVIAVTAETETHYGIMMANRTIGWINKSALEVESPLPEDWMTRVSAGNNEVISEAFRYIGLPYRYGGRLPYDIDCSLFVQSVFRAKGVNLPRTAAAQSQVGTPVSLSEIAPGDRLYFINSRGQIGHAGIYIGSGQIIHASSRRGCVAVDNLAGSYLQTLTYIRR
jgi:hypothetical protein